MTSTGNDIVSLRQLDIGRAAHPRFYSKILTLQEQELYDCPQFANLPFTHFVWMLWSVKESAFKYLKRLNIELQFSPIKTVIINAGIDPLESSINSWQHYTGRVQYADALLYFKSEISGDWIFSVVDDKPNFENIFSGIESIDSCNYESQSGLAKTFLLKKLNSLVSGKLNIKKNPVGYPMIFDDDVELPIPISLSHDGNFVGYTFVLNSPLEYVQ